MPARSETSILMAQKRFLNEVEQGIRAANREVVHKLIPTLDNDSFFGLAVAVAKLRANYLEAALRMSRAKEPTNPATIAELRTKRELYDEGRLAFEALQRAIERGYVDIADGSGKAI